MQPNKSSQGISRPKKFDYNLLVIGAGSGGLVSAYIAAALKSKVGLIEKHKMGGDCLNTGCVPSKALIKTAKVMAMARDAKKYGIKSIQVDFDFADAMERVQNVIKKIEPHDSVKRYTSLGVDCIEGDAFIMDPWHVRVGEKVLSARSMIIATGASPHLPGIEGLNPTDVLTSENIWQIRKLPQKLIVLGGGPIGCEMAQCFQRLGSQVTLIEMGTQLMGKEDSDVAESILKKFKGEGIRVLTGHKATSIADNWLSASGPEGDTKISFDQIFLALGRRANTKGFGLEELGIELNKDGTIAHNRNMSTTKYGNIFVCGDVAGPYQFTHTASHQAYYACINALFLPILRWLPQFMKRSLNADYSVIPWVTYTDPEVATVGLNETLARQQGIDFEVTRYGIDDLDRAIAETTNEGFIKVLTKPGSDEILGATIVGQNAGEILVEFTSCMRAKKGLNHIMGTIHPYPTMSETNKFAAGQWKQKHKPEGALKWLERFFSWLL